MWYTITMRDAKTLRVIGTAIVKGVNAARDRAKDCCRTLNVAGAEPVEMVVEKMKPGATFFRETYTTGTED